MSANNVLFYVQKIATDYRCKGMPLSSFLLKPMQRITRYPLHIKNVGHPSRDVMEFLCDPSFTCYSLEVCVCVDPGVHSRGPS